MNWYWDWYWQFWSSELDFSCVFNSILFNLTLEFCSVYFFNRSSLFRIGFYSFIQFKLFLSIVIGPLASVGPINIDHLLSQLVATGILQAPTAAPGASASSTVAPDANNREESASAAVGAPAVAAPVALKEINLSDSEMMKTRQNGVVSTLYSGMQCGSCGLRFQADQTVRYSSHLDWHFRQNRREKGASKRPQSRKWFVFFIFYLFGG